MLNQAQGGGKLNNVRWHIIKTTHLKKNGRREEQMKINLGGIIHYVTINKQYRNEEVRRL